MIKLDLDYVQNNWNNVRDWGLDVPWIFLTVFYFIRPASIFGRK